MNLQIDYAFKREWSFPKVNMHRYLILDENWQSTKTIVNTHRDKLKNGAVHPDVITVAAVGSLGRMEASDESDVDIVIVVKDDKNDKEATDAFDSVWQALELDEKHKPKKDGVFSKPISADTLCGKNIGNASEEMRVFGKRLLLLLESQPLYDDLGYDALITDIVNRYAKGYVDTDPNKEWTFLLNDLLRYFRALCVNYQFDFENDNRKWPLRNIKLRHSRVVMYSGLLFLLGEESVERTDKIASLLEKLRLTPLERLAYAYERNKDWSFYRIAGLYNTFLGKINDPDIRKALIDQGEYKDRYLAAHYSDLKANSDSLVAELLRFVMSQRGRWSERLFEYLLF